MAGFFVVANFNFISTAKNSLATPEKLKSRKTIEQLFKGGKAITQFPIRLAYCYPEIQAEPVKVGFSVSSRNFKQAVRRNRIKRLMREAYRLQKHGLIQEVRAKQKKLAIFFIYTGREVPDYNLIFQKLGITLEKLSRSIQ